MQENRETKYGFAQMIIDGKPETIKCKKADRDRVLFRLRSACSYARKNGLNITCWADETGVHYKRNEPTEEMLLKLEETN